jgi:hypothetical protein
VLVGKFLTDFADMVDSWAAWARGVVAAWPDDPKGADPDMATIERIASRSLPRLEPTDDV